MSRRGSTRVKRLLSPTPPLDNTSSDDFVTERQVHRRKKARISRSGISRKTIDERVRDRFYNRRGSTKSRGSHRGRTSGQDGDEDGGNEHSSPSFEDGNSHLVSNVSKDSTRLPTSKQRPTESERRKCSIAKLEAMASADLEDLVRRNVATQRQPAKAGETEKDDGRPVSTSSHSKAVRTSKTSTAEAERDFFQNIDEQIARDDPDDEEIQVEAIELASMLAVPFDRLRERYLADGKTAHEKLASDVHTACDHLSGQEICERLISWRNSQLMAGRNAAERWDGTTAYIAAKKTKIEEVIDRIKMVNQTKEALVLATAKHFDEALTRQETELKGLKAEMQKAQGKYRTKMLEATDPLMIDKRIKTILMETLNPGRG